MQSKFYFLISLYILFICFAMTSVGVATAVVYRVEGVENGKVLGAEETADLEVEPMADFQPNFLPAAKDREVKPLKRDNVRDPQIDAGAGVVVDCATGQPLYGNNPDKAVPIASISKLAAALVFLEFNPGWEKEYKFTIDDRREGGKIYVYTGETVNVKDLFHVSLVGSGNSETLALVHSTGKSEKEFVDIMNARMKELGLKNTFFIDPIGLDANNRSTAFEVAKIAQLALKNEAIAEAVTSKSYKLKTKAGRQVVISNTDALLSQYPRDGITLLGGKTGYIDSAGYCFVGKFKNGANREVISVVLGGHSRNSRFDYTNDLVKWTYDSFVWQ